MSDEIRHVVHVPCKSKEHAAEMAQAYAGRRFRLRTKGWPGGDALVTDCWLAGVGGVVLGMSLTPLTADAAAAYDEAPPGAPWVVHPGVVYYCQLSD